MERNAADRTISAAATENWCKVRAKLGKREYGVNEDHAGYCDQNDESQPKLLPGEGHPTW